MRWRKVEYEFNNDDEKENEGNCNSMEIERKSGIGDQIQRLP